MAQKRDKIDQLNDIDRLQARDVLDYLIIMKENGQRPLTSKEIICYFNGTISSQAVYKQLKRLKKWKQLRSRILKDKKYEVLVYEAV